MYTFLLLSLEDRYRPHVSAASGRIMKVDRIWAWRQVVLGNFKCNINTKRSYQRVSKPRYEAMNCSRWKHHKKRTTSRKILLSHICYATNTFSVAQVKYLHTLSEATGNTSVPLRVFGGAAFSLRLLTPLGNDTSSKQSWRNSYCCCCWWCFP